MIFPTLFLSYFSDVLTMIMTSVSAIFLFISASLSVYVKYIPLISRVFGAYCKLRTEFFPSI